MHAVYPGTFDPFTPGHRDVAQRARRLFDRLTILVAVNGEKEPTDLEAARAEALRRSLPADWTNVEVIPWRGLTAESSTALRALRR